jgi:2-amino-4-hydroxy-6-hydroxymethyldihydropteridine diphosphokinase
MSTAYIALGANLGNREATLEQALQRLGAEGEVVAVSPWYETAPVGYLDQPDFLNGVACLETSTPPEQLMERLIEIESDLGRKRSFPNAPRRIDLDLLYYDDLILESPLLTLPHPRLHERSFVLVPLRDIAPDLVHPVLGKTTSELADAVWSEGVTPFSGGR